MADSMMTMEEPAQTLVEKVQECSEQFDLASLAKNDEDETKANEAKHLAMHECYKFCQDHRRNLKEEYEKANEEGYNHYLSLLEELYYYAQLWLHNDFFVRKMPHEDYRKAYNEFIVPEGVEKFKF